MKFLFILISFFVSCDLCAQDKIVFSGKPDTVFCKIKSVTASAIFYIEKGEHKSDYIKNVSYQSVIQNGTARTENEKIEIANAFMAQNIKKLNKAELREQLYVLITKIFSLKNENVNLEKSKSELSLSLSLLKQDIASLTVLIEKNEIENAKLNKTILTLKDTLACIRSAQEVKVKETDVTRAGLKGKVKFYSISYCHLLGTEVFKLTNKFDEKGNQIKSIEYNTNKNLWVKYTYTYDEKGNVLGTIGFDDGNMPIKSTYKYDDRGKLIEEKSYYEEGDFISKYTYKYDEKGKQIESNSYNDVGKLENKMTTKYDAKGNIIELIWYNGDGSFSSKTTNKYDEKGNQIELIRYNGVGKLERKTTTNYDEKGNQIELIRYNGVGSLNSKNTCKYDDKGNLVEENEYDGSGKLDRKTNTEYDSEGNSIKIIIQDEYGITTDIPLIQISYYK